MSEIKNTTQRIIEFSELRPPYDTASLIDISDEIGKSLNNAELALVPTPYDEGVSQVFRSIATPAIAYLAFPNTDPERRVITLRFMSYPINNNDYFLIVQRLVPLLGTGEEYILPSHEKRVSVYSHKPKFRMLISAPSYMNDRIHYATHSLDAQGNVQSNYHCKV